MAKHGFGLGHYYNFKKLRRNKMTKIEIDLDEITKQMDELKDTKARLEFELKMTKEEIEKNELKLIALLNQTGVDEMQFGVYSFGLKITKRKAFDQKLFGSDYPDLLDKYKVEKESEKFEFKINK
jgi:hypothetical protein